MYTYTVPANGSNSNRNVVSAAEAQLKAIFGNGVSLCLSGEVGVTLTLKKVKLSSEEKKELNNILYESLGITFSDL